MSGSGYVDWKDSRSQLRRCPASIGHLDRFPETSAPREHGGLSPFWNFGPRFKKGTIPFLHAGPFRLTRVKKGDCPLFACNPAETAVVWAFQPEPAVADFAVLGEPRGATPSPAGPVGGFLRVPKGRTPPHAPRAARRNGASESIIRTSIFTLSSPPGLEIMLWLTDRESVLHERNPSDGRYCHRDRRP